MKTIYSISLLFAISFTSHSQIADTCDYVAQTNTIGGLDCAMLSLAQYTADSYQWLDCDNSFAPIPGDTTSYFTGSVTTYSVALAISVYGCIDTSQCNPVCYFGLEELLNNDVELIGVFDLMGRKTEDKPNTLQIYVYNDGTTEKVFRVE